MYYSSYFNNIIKNSYKKFLLTKEGNLDENSNKIINQPERIIKPLKDHQKTLIYKMRKLEESNNNIYKNICPPTKKYKKIVSSKIAVLADKVGSGKSLTILSVIGTQLYINNNIILEMNNQTMISVYKQYNDNYYIKTNIIVVPHNIIKQWEKYII